MLSLPAVMDVPLRTDEHGVIRIGNTRVTLQTVITAHLQGDTPRQIVENFDVLKLDHVLVAIAYYIQHRDEVEAYMRQQKEAGEQLRQKLETEHPEMFVLQEKFRKLLEEKNGDNEA